DEVQITSDRALRSAVSLPSPHHCDAFSHDSDSMYHCKRSLSDWVLLFPQMTFCIFRVGGVPTADILTPRSPPSRRELETGEIVASASQRSALTAAAPGVFGLARVGTKKRFSGRTKKLKGMR